MTTTWAGQRQRRPNWLETWMWNPPTLLWGHQAWEIVPPPYPLRCGPTSTILHGGGPRGDSGRIPLDEIEVGSSWGLQTLASSVWKRNRALQTLANSMRKRYWPTKIVIRASSTHFTQASVAKMGCERPRSAQNGHKKPNLRHKVGSRSVCMCAGALRPPVSAPFGAEGRCALLYD